MSKTRSHSESTPENHFTSTLFTHEWITYDPKKLEVTFSDEAKWELQKLIETIQSGFPIEINSSEPPTESVNIKEINEATIANVADAMIVAGKWKKSIEKFLERVKILLQWKKKWWKFKETEKKVEKKVEKYQDTLFAHIIVQYIEWWEKKYLQEAPMIIRSWEKIEKILYSLQTRLRFAHIKSK